MDTKLIQLALETISALERIEKAYAFYIPTEEDIRCVVIGSYAPDSMGKWAKVVEITAQKDDIYGVPFVCYYVESSNSGSKIAGSMKAGKLVRTVRLSRHYKSLELDDIEAEMKKRMIQAMPLEVYQQDHKESWHKPVEKFKH